MAQNRSGDSSQVSLLRTMAIRQFLSSVPAVKMRTIIGMETMQKTGVVSGGFGQRIARHCRLTQSCTCIPTGPGSNCGLILPATHPPHPPRCFSPSYGRCRGCSRRHCCRSLLPPQPTRKAPRTHPRANLECVRPISSRTAPRQPH